MCSINTSKYTQKNTTSVFSCNMLTLCDKLKQIFKNYTTMQSVLTSANKILNLEFYGFNKWKKQVDFKNHVEINMTSQWKFFY